MWQAANLLSHLTGYAHVDAACFKRSATARLYERLVAHKSELHAAHELSADYDGLGVRWGIGHKKSRWEVRADSSEPSSTKLLQASTSCSQPSCSP